MGLFKTKVHPKMSKIILFFLRFLTRDYVRYFLFYKVFETSKKCHLAIQF